MGDLLSECGKWETAILRTSFHEVNCTLDAQMILACIVLIQYRSVTSTLTIGRAPLL